MKQLEEMLSVLNKAHKEMEKKNEVKKSLFERVMNKLGWYKGQYNLGVIDTSKFSFFANTELKPFVEHNEWQYVTRYGFNKDPYVTVGSKGSM